MDDRQAWSKAGEGRWQRTLADGTIATLRVDHWEALLGPSDDLGYWSCGENDLGIAVPTRDEAVAYVRSALEGWQRDLGFEPDGIAWDQASDGHPVAGVTNARPAPGEDAVEYLACVAPVLELDVTWTEPDGATRMKTVPLNATLDARTRFSTSVEWGMREADGILDERDEPER